RLGVCIPQMAARRKQEVVGARDAAVTLLSQPLGRRCHVCVGILHAASTLTKYRSTPCLHINETPNTTPKPNTAVIAQRRTASHATAARHNTLLRPFSRPSMIWGCLKPS